MPYQIKTREEAIGMLFREVVDQKLTRSELWTKAQRLLHHHGKQIPSVSSTDLADAVQARLITKV